MTFKNILIPTDGSEFTKKAIEEGIKMAKIAGGTITAVYILDQSIYSNMPMDSTIVDLYNVLKNEGKTATEYVLDRCRAEGIDSKAKIIEGIPSKAIVNMSKDYDLIVMGTLGKKGITKVLIGSVTEKVIEKSSCPVMTISASSN